MSRRIFFDVEEAIAREVRRITTFDDRTRTDTVFQEIFDPFTGEIVKKEIEPSFYDSSANASHIDYPHFFIKLLRSEEDTASSRSVPPYGRNIECPVVGAPKAYTIKLSLSNITVNTGTNTLIAPTFKIRKVEVDDIIRLTNGTNKGTYIVDSVSIQNDGNHIITVKNLLVEDLPDFDFESTTREITFLDKNIDLNTVKITDIFTDSLSNSFAITDVNVTNGTIKIDGVAAPDQSAGGFISRSSPVFTEVESGTVSGLVLDPESLITSGGMQVTQSYESISPQIPLNLYYMVRIDSKERDDHIMSLNRIWEEMNPPRSGLPTIIRSKNSAEVLLTADITSGGSQIVNVESTEHLNPGDLVYIFDDFTPTKKLDSEGSFQRPFETVIKRVISNTQIEVKNVVPDTFIVSKCAKIVTNASFYVHEFQFLDHRTRDVEGEQYWVHEIDYLVQVWIDRLETPRTDRAINDIYAQLQDLEGNSFDGTPIICP